MLFIVKVSQNISFLFSLSPKDKDVVPSSSGEDDLLNTTPGFNSSHSEKKRLRRSAKYAMAS